MPNRLQYSYFSILPAEDWTSAVRSLHGASFLALTLIAGDGQLRLTIPSEEQQSFDAKEWVRIVAETNRKRGRPVFAAHCGDFSGYNTQVTFDQDWYSNWVLHAGQFALDATYFCGTCSMVRHDVVVEEMLNTLRLESKG